MKQSIVIITGGSKGIGKALAEQYYNNKFTVYSLARTKSDLPKKVNQIKINLTDLGDLQNVLQNIFYKINFSTLKSITLINNAGRLGKISNLENIPITDIETSIKLNISAPLQLSSLFIKFLQKKDIKKTIINISSGAAVSPYAGWTVYCASKASIDMITNTVALEQKKEQFPVKIIAIRPGVVATNMQKQIRTTSSKDFKLVSKFIDLYKNNKLLKPKNVAEEIYKIDKENILKNGSIVDLREL